MPRRLSGLIAAPFTPFRRDGAVNLAQVGRLALQLSRNGVNGAFICGTTGEGYSLTLRERMKLADRWAQDRPKSLALVVHVGHSCLADCRQLARHAARLGVDAIATIAPNFYKPARVHDLVAWCREIAAAAPETPFYYYHMPSMTGVSFSTAEFLALAGPEIPTLAGVKFTHEDLMDYARARAAANGRFNLLFGRDEILLAGLALGAPGAVGSTYNYAAPIYLELMKTHAAGDLPAARTAQGRAVAMIDVMAKAGGLPAGKAIMRMIGLDCGPVRLPLRDLSAAEYLQMERSLDEIGFRDFCSRER